MIVNNNKMNTSTSSSKDEIEILDKEKFCHKEHKALKELKSFERNNNLLKEKRKETKKDESTDPKIMSNSNTKGNF